MSLPKIGAVLALDGERDYKNAITSINSAQRALRAEMKLATEEFSGQENGIEALTKKNKILEDQYSEQKTKVQICQAALEKYAKAQEDVGKKVADATKEYQNAEERLEEMKKASETTTKEIAKQESVVKQAKAQLEKVSVQYEKLGKKETEWKTSLANAKTELLKTDRALQENREYLEDARKATDKHAKSIDEYGKKVKEAGEDSEEFGDKTEATIITLSEVMATGKIIESAGNIAEAMFQCVDAAAEFETAMAKVGTIADQTDIPLDTMSEDVMKLSAELGVAATEIAEATYEAISAGQSTKDAVGFAGQATKLAMGGFTDSATSVDILTTALNAYGLEAERTEEISDMLITTQNLGKVTVAELASTMGRVIPLASAYNVEMDNLSSAYALMTSNGIDAAETTTYIKAMLTELGDSNSKVSKILTEQTGKSFAQLSGEGKTLGDVMQILGSTVEGDASKFSELWSSSEAGIGALSLLNSGSDKYNKTLEAMRKSCGATDAAFRQMTDTTEMAEQRMKNGMQNLSVAVGDVLRPEIEELYETGANIAEWAAEFVEEHPVIVQAIAAITAGVVTFTAALTAATAAAKAYTMIKALINPHTLLASAIIGASAAALAFTASLDKERTEVQKAESETRALVKSSKELRETQAESAEARKASRKELETEAAICRNLSEELVALQSKTKLSNTEQAKQQSIVTQLNQAIPDLNLAIDEQTGKLNMSCEALLENVEAMNELAIAAAAQEDLAEIAAQQWENEKKLVELREQEIEQRQAMQEAENEYNEALERQKETGEEVWSEMANYGYAQEAYHQLTEQIRETEKAQAALGEEWGATQEFISDTSALYGAADATAALGEAGSAAGGSIEESAARIEASYAEMSTSIRESVKEQIDIFAEYEKENSISSEKLLSNMRSQIEGVQEWGDNLSELAGRSDENGRMISEGLLKYLVDLGPEGAQYVAAFAQMTDEELKEANALWAESISLPDEIAGEFEESGIALMEGLKKGIEHGTEEVNTSMKNVSKGGKGAFDKESGGINGPSKKMMESGKGLMEGLLLGIKTVAPSVKEETRTLASDVTAKTKSGMLGDNKAEKPKAIGKQFSGGLASGIRAGKSEAINAAIEVSEAAITAARTKLRINSPSKVTEEMGGSFIEGWVKGIRANTENLRDAVSGALEASMIAPAREGSRSAGAEITRSGGSGSAPVNIYIQPQQMSNEELDRTFDYINERFGYAL